MSLPAQTIQLPEPLHNLSSKDTELDKFVRSKYNSLKESGELRLVLTRNYKPTDELLYQQIKLKLQDYAKQVKENEAQNIDEFLPILMGNVEGRPGSADPMLLLIEEFGPNIENIKIEDIIRERTKVNKYGTDKKRQTVRECDKKTLDILSSFYDVNAIKNHRKVCATAKNYLKSYRKFIDTVQKSNQTITEMSQAHMSYIQFMKEEIDFNKIRVTFQQISTMMEAEENQMKEQTPAKPKANKSKKKHDTASTHKNKQGAQEAKQEEGASLQVKNEDKDSEKQKGRGTRTKEQIEKQKMKKQLQIEAKKRQKQEKQKEKQLQKQKQRVQKAEKQRLKQLERQAKQQEKKAKQEQKQAKQRQRQKQKQLKQQQRQAKQAQKKRKQEEKQKKNHPGQSLFNFFKPKITMSQGGSPEKIMQKKEILISQNEQKNKDQNTTDDFLELIKNQTTPIQVCRQRFFTHKMKDQNSCFQPFYINIFTHRSRLQFTNFLIHEPKISVYVQPHFQIENGKYDDSSVEYEDLCGDICNDEADQISAEQEEEENEENSAIVPDDYLSGDEMSNSQESKDEIVVNIDKGGQWCFSGVHPIADKYQMYCLYEEESYPLCLTQTQQSNQLNLSLKCELYKQIHGYFGAKDTLIKKLALITDKVSKSYLDSLIKETTTKKGHQRLVKPQIIEFLNEQKEGFSQQLQQIKVKRGQERQLQAVGKVSQKEKQIERLILEQAGTYYIIDLLQFLREKGFKMRKNDLKSFIEQRVGSQWDDIRRRMQKMQLKVTQFARKTQKKQQENQKQKQQKIENQIINGQKVQQQKSVQKKQLQKESQNRQNEMQPQ